MARAYTAELRERVLRGCARGGLSRAALAQLFGVGESTLYRWQQIWRAEGRREAKPHAGGPAPRLDATALGQLKELVAARNDRTLAEYATALGERADRVPGARKARPQAQKRACARPSRTGPISPGRGRTGGPSSPGSSRSGSSFLTRAASTRG
jgi:transposase